jgi:hypothetical protein
MAAAEPAQRAQELQFLLRLLTERPPLPTGIGGPEARSYPIGNWFRSSIEPSAADAINLSMAAMGPKARVPSPEVGRLGEFASTTPGRIISQTKKKGGYSVNLPTGDVPETGIMAGKFANADPRTRVLDKDPTMVDITDWVKQNEKVLGKTENYVGTWKDKDSGKTYLDVSRRFEPEQLRPATKFAEKTGQIAIYNVGTGMSPPVGSYPKYVSGEFTPEGVAPYSQRLHEMGAEGAGYMAQHPTADWWETPDIQRVYGTASRPQQAGFMGAVSTNTQPRPNVQGMSEYMRRYIKGEPIVQPEFKVPPTAMGGFAGPGKSMGLESGRAFNLERAAEGNLEAMRGEVVREKTQALTGNPMAMVLDRIHARLTEAPQAGIYAHSQEATMPEGGDRQLVKDAISKQAALEGKNPRQFSADVWAGIREHIKRTGELYGTPLAKTQSGTQRSPSKSYNDLFVDLVKQKADHLGISVAEMEKRLRSGDGELLSWLLATPAGAALYKFSRSAQSELVGSPSNVAP